MELKGEREVAATRHKLARLEARYEALREDFEGDSRVRQLSMMSLKQLTNQFKEEIARFEAHQIDG